MTEEMRVIRHGPDAPPMKIQQRVFTASGSYVRLPVARHVVITNRKSFGSA